MRLALKVLLRGFGLRVYWADPAVPRRPRRRRRRPGPAGPDVADQLSLFPPPP